MMSKPEQESPFVENHTKNSDIERHALATIFVFTPQENPTMRKGCLEENTQHQNIDACTTNVSMRQKL